MPLLPPSGGAQQEPMVSAAPKSDFHTSLLSAPNQNSPAPLAGGSKALSKCGSGGRRGFRRPEETFSQEPALCCSLYRGS